MEKFEKIRNEIRDFDKQVGWSKVSPKSANALSSLLIAEAVELWEEIAKESKHGIDKYDVSLEVADVYIFLQKLCIALDIDMLEAVEDKMLINRARFLNEEYKQNILMPSPKKDRLYKVNRRDTNISVGSKGFIQSGYLNGVKDKEGNNQLVYILTDEPQDVYMVKIDAVVIPRDKSTSIWIAALDNNTSDYIVSVVDKLILDYDIDLV